MATTVTSKGQVTIPGSLRARYGFAPGTMVEWVERGGELIPKPVRSVDALCRSLPPIRGRASLAEQLLGDRRADTVREDG